MISVWRFKNLFFPAVLFLVACEEGIQQFEPEPNVFAVMNIREPKYGYQEILIDRSYNIEDTLQIEDSSFSDVVGVAGAKAIVWSDGDTFFFEEFPYGSEPPGHYFTLYQVPEFKDTISYTLEVILPWGDTVTGQAMMPTPLSITWPKDYDTISISEEVKDSNLICWNKCQNIISYMINFTEEYWGKKVCFAYFTADTCCPFFALRADCLQECVEPYQICVMAFSKEYTDYLDPRNGGKANLSRGYGVFTGITMDTKMLYIVE